MSVNNFFTWKAKADGERMDLTGGVFFGKRKLLRGDLDSKSSGKFSHIRESKNNVTVLDIYAGPQSIARPEGDSEPHFVRSDVWIGAEASNGLLDQKRMSGDRARQVFRLEFGQHLLFFDSAKEATKLTARTCGEYPTIERATRVEVADHILWVDSNRGNNPKTITWCYHVLMELGCQSQIDEFARRHPGFSV